MDKFIYIPRALKQMLIISTSAILGFKVVNQIYDIQMIIYFIIGFFGYILFSLWEDSIKDD